jgi:hypothetical protein
MLHHPTITPGTVLDLPDEEAVEFVRQMRAEFVIEAPEAAVIEPKERAVKPKPKPRGPKSGFSAKKG